MIALARALLDLLIASLWQGAFIAIAVAAVLAFAGRGLNAATRSIVLQGALAAIVIVPLLTTLPYVMAHASSVGGSTVAGSLAGLNAASPNEPARTDPRRIDVALSDRAALVLAGAWIAGVLAFALRLGAGSLQLARLVRRSKRLADRAGVRLYASPDIGVPIAFGFVSPIVVVPTALAAEAGEEFECIVLHELAHVRRRDAWANACERALQVVLFFNPAVLLVLRAIALERESACDDWAVAQSRDLDTYTRSLASFAVWGASARAVSTCGAAGFGGATVARIRRLDDARRNGTVTLSRFAIGGFTAVLFFLALTLHSFAPAIAFAPQTPAVQVAATSTGCKYRPVRLPVPRASMHLKKFKFKADTKTTASGDVTDVTVVESSGSAAYDRAMVAALKHGNRCKKPVEGVGHFEIQAQGLNSDGRSTAP